MPIKYYVQFILAHHVYIHATTCISSSPGLIHAFSGLLPFAYTIMDHFKYHIILKFTLIDTKMS
jgi:hypothetical protein